MPQNNFFTLKYRSALLIVGLILIADQALKIFVKTHFAIGDEVKMAGEWFKLHFIENEGMAYGMKLSENVAGKLALSLFRLGAVGYGFFLLHDVVKKKYTTPIIVSGALILAGALGNLIDSLFYGILFTDSPATCFSAYYDSMNHLLNSTGHSGSIARWATSGAKGYGHILQGKVVDMLYFPLIDAHWPSFMPVVGGKPFTFFEPVFNIADAAISIGVGMLLWIGLFSRDKFWAAPPSNASASSPLPENTPAE